MINYFISYNFTKGKESGSGCCDIHLKNKIRNMDDLLAVSDHIKNEYDYDGVVIMYWKKF